MKFVQIIDFTTDDFEAVQQLEREWQAATEGKRTVTRVTVCADRDKPGRYLSIVEFPSHEAATENDKLPETQELAEKLAKICGPPTFLNLDVVEELD